MLFQHFDWDLTHQILFLYIYFAQPSYELERPALDNAHTLENIHTLVQRTDILSCKFSVKVSLMLDNPFLVPSICKWNHIQTRNQDFFRAGEFSWNQGTSINISSATHERKALQEKNMDFFLLETLKITFKIRNLTQNGHNQDIFFPKLGECFPIFEKGQGRPPPPSPSSYAPDISLCFIQINTKSPAKLLILFRESTVFLKSSPMFWAAR